MVGKNLEIFLLGVGESTGLLPTNWETSRTYSPKDNLWSISEIVDGERRESHVFRKKTNSNETNHYDFALTVRCRSLLFMSRHMLAYQYGKTARESERSHLRDISRLSTFQF